MVITIRFVKILKSFEFNLPKLHEHLENYVIKLNKHLYLIYKLNLLYKLIFDYFFLRYFIIKSFKFMTI